MTKELETQLDFGRFDKKKVAVLDGIKKIYVLNYVYINWSSSTVHFLGVFESLDKAKLETPVKVEKFWKQEDKNTWIATRNSESWKIKAVELDQKVEIELL